MLEDAGSVGVESTGMGTAYRGLSWLEIMAWVEGAGLQDLSPFWRRQVRALSGILASSMNAATETQARAPYEPPDD